MMTNHEIALEELCYELAMVERSERIEFLDRLTRTHPQHARDLTDFAVELAFDEVRDVGADAQVAADTDPLVARAMSNFQNRLYTLDHEGQESVDPSNHELRGRGKTKDAPVNPFATLTHAEMRDIAAELQANTLLVIKLRDRTIRPDTITRGFRQRTAELLGVPEAVVAAHFGAPPEIRSDALYKSDRKPVVVEQESFLDAVANCGLEEEQRRYLLSL